VLFSPRPSPALSPDSPRFDDEYPHHQEHDHDFSRFLVKTEHPESAGGLKPSCKITSISQLRSRTSRGDAESENNSPEKASNQTRHSTKKSQSKISDQGSSKLKIKQEVDKEEKKREDLLKLTTGTAGAELAAARKEKAKVFGGNMVAISGRKLGKARKRMDESSDDETEEIVAPMHEIQRQNRLKCQNADEVPRNRVSLLNQRSSPSGPERKLATLWC
jgi:hypothetical protein